MDRMPAPTPESIATLAAASGPDTTGTAGETSGDAPPENLHVEFQRAADGSPQTQTDTVVPPTPTGVPGGGPPGMVESLQATDRIALPPPLGSTPKAPGTAPTTMVALPPPLGARPARRTGVWVLLPGEANAQLVEHVNDLPNMPEWLRPCVTAGLDADLITTCKQLEVPRVFQNWLAHYGMTSRKLVGSASTAADLHQRIFCVAAK